MKLTDDKKRLLVVHLPDTRGVEISPYGKGNLKIGAGVFTYSRIAGKENGGTCPGSTPECEAICYAKRITGPVRDQYWRNSTSSYVPPIPEDCKLLRIHISGDFDTTPYIENWIIRLQERPDVTAWAYTRSWRVSELVDPLERLRALPNMQLFASMDVSTVEFPPPGWRIAWIDEDSRIHGQGDNRLAMHSYTESPFYDRYPAYVCPEQTGRKINCAECRYCFDGQKHDVVFLRH